MFNEMQKMNYDFNNQMSNIEDELKALNLNLLASNCEKLGMEKEAKSIMTTLFNRYFKK